MVSNGQLVEGSRRRQSKSISILANIFLGGQFKNIDVQHTLNGQ